MHPVFAGISANFLIVTAMALATLTARAEPPVFTPPEKIIPVNGYAVYDPPASAGIKEVEYEGLSGENPIPFRLFGGSKTAFVFPVRGLPANREYKFVGVASNGQGELTKKYFSVVIGTPTTPPTEPPVTDPPVTPPTGKYYFLIVRPDGPASADFTRVMRLPEWSNLTTAGHTVKDKTKTEATLIGAKLDGVTLPAVVILEDVGANHKQLKAVPLPTDGAGVTALPSKAK